MSSALERRLVVVTGKGGVGKTTVSAALGLLGARRGLRTIVVEVTGGEASGEAGMGRLAALLGHAQPPAHGVETELGEGLWGLAVDRDRVLAEWLRAIGGLVPARVLTASSSFQYLIAAAPGVREMIVMVKLWELAQGRRPAERGSRDGHASVGRRDYDLVVFDAPATGHALAMLRSPHTFGTIARVGPVARQSGQVRELLEDPARSAYLAVTQATEMGVTETLELREGLRRELGRELDAVILNGTLPVRFEGGELRRIAALAETGTDSGDTRSAAAGERSPVASIPVSASIPESASAAGACHPASADTAVLTGATEGDAAVVTGSAVRAAHAIHERARAQQRQIARLRREEGPNGAPPVLRVPFMFRSELDLDALGRIADRLERGL